MDKKLFLELAQSMQQMGEITCGERAPSRETRYDPMEVKRIRAATGLSQAQFAKAISVEVGTLRNWEQGRRSPTGPAQALLKAIRKDPEHVMQALCDSPQARHATTTIDASSGVACAPHDGTGVASAER